MYTPPRAVLAVVCLSFVIGCTEPTPLPSVGYPVFLGYRHVDEVAADFPAGAYMVCWHRDRERQFVFTVYDLHKPTEDWWKPIHRHPKMGVQALISVVSGLPKGAALKYGTHYGKNGLSDEELSSLGKACLRSGVALVTMSDDG